MGCHKKKWATMMTLKECGISIYLIALVVSKLKPLMFFR
jgi:hypothetical protein